MAVQTASGPSDTSNYGKPDVRPDGTVSKRPTLEKCRGNRHPMRQAGLFSRVFFIWMFGFFRRGYKRPVVEEDLYEVLPEDSSSVLVGKLEREWHKELEKSRTTGRPPSLRWALLRAFGLHYMLYGIPVFMEEVIFKVAQPLMLSRLILYFSTDLVSTTEAYLQAAGISLAALCILTCDHSSQFAFGITGMRLRTACSSLVFRKALRLSHLALGETAVGQLVNILSNDVNRFDLVVFFVHFLWTTPLQLIAVTVLAWREIGESSIAGLSILILMTPLQAYAGKMFGKLRSKTAVLSDARIRIMNEVISGIRVIKVYAWERSFGQLVAKTRRKEIQKVMQAAYLTSLSLALLYSGPLLTTFVTFVVYASLGNPVTSSKVFPVLSLFFAVRIGLTICVSNAIMSISEVVVSVRRIQKCLLLEELEIHGKPTGSTDDAASSLQLDELEITAKDDQTAREATERISAHEGAYVITEHSENARMLSINPVIRFEGGDQAGRIGPALDEKDDKPDDAMPSGNRNHGAGIVVESLSGSWTKDTSNAVLRDISFRVEPGELLAVIGPVGCGKSSLLMALLGELPVTSGVNALSGRVGYTAQQPWILSGSLRANVIFGSKYDPAKFQQVINQCALVRDIELLPDGDQTLVGERGVTLSGGQRARVSLARAVYSDADVYLLDDPLSAVDPAVGRHLFDKCIQNRMKNKPRILVTHQLQFLDKADKILILKEGKVAGYGTYQELQEHGVDFAALLKKKSEDGDYDGESENESRDKTLSRQMSTVSDGSSYQGPDEVERPVDIAPEEMAVGTVEWRVYVRYFRAAAGIPFLLVWTFVAIGGQALLSFTDVWLAKWAEEEDSYLASRNITIQANSVLNSLLIRGSDPTGYHNATEFENQPYYIRTYAILCAVTVITVFVRSFLFFHLFVAASRALHNQMFDSIIRVPMHFFDTNPVGRVLNRFSKDIGYMDDVLPATFADCFQISVYAIAIVIVITVFNPFCIVYTLPILIVFVFTRRFYLASSRDVRRLEGIARSPIYSHLSATLAGLTTVRAFKVQQRFTEEFDGYLDGHTRAWFLLLATTRWFALQLDFFCVMFVCGVSFTSVMAADLFNLNSAIVGLSLTYAVNLMGAFQWAVRQSAELENQMTSVERVCQYSDIKPEAPLETDHKPPPDWPQDGGITFKDASLRYTDDGPLVLQNINCCISSEEKIGIVGRTGAGKSSLMTVLMRLAEPTGTIVIDGIDIALIGLHDLRKKISFIPQDPVLFSGTLRKNLDPFDDHSDSDLWRAIENVELKPAVEELPDKLEAILTEGGTNFSVGQRQLLCLARAILRKNKILIVDEATANVDIRTDRLIQATIRERFKHCTVLTIAHRLNTIMDSDRILVLDAGRLIEFDEPYILLQEEHGAFAKMVQEAGKAEMAKLREVAKEKYHQKNSSDP